MSYPVRLALAVLAAVASVTGGASSDVAPTTTPSGMVAQAVANADSELPRVAAVDVDGAADARTAQLSAQADLISKAVADLQAAAQAKSRATAKPLRPVTSTPVGAPGDPREIARQMMLSLYGWDSSQFQCFDNIIMHESKWSVTATNPSSGAYGIPQALPGSKMATAGADWQTNAATQIKWALGYVKGRYGTPCGAWSFKSANGWY